MYMSKQRKANSAPVKWWYVMVHHSPQWIETMLHRESLGELQKQEQQDAAVPLEPFEFFVPFQFMRPDTSDEVRSIFHNFVFISASDERMSQILASDWNTQSRLHLYHYRDRAGHKIRISDEEFQQLKAVFINRQLKVFFGLPVEPIDKMAVGDRVTLLLDDWKWRQGKIERIRFHKGRVSMRVAVNILGQTKSINFEDLHDGDVIFADQDTEQLLSGNLISNMEKQVVNLLGHRFRNASAETLRRDYPRLNRLLSYAGVQIDHEDDQRRFSSLMLMCAALLGEQGLIDRYQSQLEQWLGEDYLSSLAAQPSSPDTSTDAYMLLALFVSTRKPQYRNAAKAYRKTHSNCPAVISSFINQVRDAPTVKPVD